MNETKRQPRSSLAIWLPLLWLTYATFAEAQSCGVGLNHLAADQAAKYRLITVQCGGSVRPDQRGDVRREAEQLQLYDRSFMSSAIRQPDAPATPIDMTIAPVAAKQPVALQRALKLAADIDATASRYDIDPLLLHAIAHVESRHNPAAISPAGARGLMQVMPSTAKRFGAANAESLSDPRTNLNVCASYLKVLQQRFGNDLSLVLAAYNAGEGAVEKHGRRIPPFAETRAYVRDVLARYEVLQVAAKKTPRAKPSSIATSAVNG